jgi:SAM-dependent methyltransferase
MREFAAEGEFDRVVSWFTSFGYFDDETNQALLTGWRRALRPGGKLLIEHQNRERFLRAIATSLDGRPVALVERGDDLLLDRTSFDVASGRTHTERISVRDGRVRRYRFSVRTFSFTELRGRLLGAGFSRVEGFGRDCQPLTLDSARMIAVASV